MPDFPIPDEPNPVWLTDVLQNAGVITTAAVAEVSVIRTEAFNSRTVYLRVRYTSRVAHAIPSRFVLKRNTPETWSITAGFEEVKFYRLVGGLKDHPQVFPTCFASGIDPASGDSFLLLEDLSKTHRSPITRDQQINGVHGVPLQAYQESVIDLLANLHAYWWDHDPSKGDIEIGFWSRNIDRFTQYMDKRIAAWQRIMDKDGSRLPDDIQVFYSQLFKRLPGYYQAFLAPRFSAPHNLTLIHGDAYFSNFLCPKIPGTEPTYLVDWQSPSIDLAAYDLVNLLATFWRREQRHENNREQVLLRRYYQGLIASGVQNYTWNEFLADYRAGLIFWVLMPVQDGGDGADWSYWRLKMQCLLEAFEDWDCWNDLYSQI